MNNRKFAPTCSHELRFASFHHPGRGVVVPCDECGHVDLDALSESLRTAYFGARALVGREYLYPKVLPVH
ncbi:MAG TPA: hypothetical protein VIW70_11255 [Rubrivivax sp.]